jgi:mono/diheme cytochrome c family protein
MVARSSSFVPSKLFASLGAGALLVAACSGTDPLDVIPPGAVQYHAHVRPIFESRCVSCHQSGGVAPFSMEFDAAEWQSGPPPWVASAIDAVESGRMPPWLPADGCRDLAYERRLSTEELATLATWKEQGLPQGVPSTYGGPRTIDAPEPLGEPDIVIEPTEAYAPREDVTDDYRCFVLPQDFTEETYLRASNVLPGDARIVHHALLFLIPPANLAAIEKLDAEEEGPGYTCFGGPGGGVLTTLGAWVPGSVTVPTQPGAAMVIPKGSRVVLQMHYNTIALDGAKPPEERSKVRLWTSKEKPTHRIELLPLAHLGMAIPAGDPASVEERVFRIPTDGTLVSLAPHMHLLGTRIAASLEPLASSADAANDACLIDIPRWDFHWQQTYALTSTSSVSVKKGDGLRVRCTYDNSAENQPMVGGTKKMPSEVTWGEGTLDEMCLLFIGMQVPFEAPDFRCGSFESCHATCADGDAGCFFDCATVGGGQCADCLIRGVGKCSPTYCLENGAALSKCLGACKDDAPKCLRNACMAEFDAFYGCMEPHIENGDCDTHLSACGL